MHRYRRAAHNAAWCDSPDEEYVGSRNPFGRRQLRRAWSGDDELHRAEAGEGLTSDLRKIRTDADYRPRVLPEERRLSENASTDQSVVQPESYIEHSTPSPSKSLAIEEVPSAVAARIVEARDAPLVSGSVSIKPKDLEHQNDQVLPHLSSMEDDHIRNRRFNGPSLFSMMKKDATAVQDGLTDNKAKKIFTISSRMKATLLCSWFNIFLPLVTVGFYIKYANSSPATTFAVNFVAILPLGLMISSCTEDLILRLSGFKSMAVIVAFSNTVQLVVTVVALVQNQTQLVRTSLIGQIIANLSLMIGSSFFLGGINRIEQSFNISLFILNLDFHFPMVLALVIPTAYHVFTNDADQESLVRISRGTAILMVSSYCMLLFWCFKTHSPVVDMLNKKNRTYERWALQTVYKYLTNKRRSCWARHKRISPNGSITSVTNERQLRGRSGYVDEDMDEGVEPQLSINTLILTLILSTIFMGFCTTFAVDSIQGLTKSTSLSQMFVGLILLPLLGCNIDAIRFAQKDNMDESLDTTVGGSIQIIGFILPMAVLIDWGRENSGMTLLFDGFQVVSVGCLAVLVRYMAQDGKSNWLEGTILLVFYAIVAVNAWYRPEPVLT